MSTQLDINLYPESLLDATDEIEILEAAAESSWRVVYTKSRQEKAFARDLLGLQIPFYLPLIKKTTQYGKRSVSSLLPIFTNYVFMFGTEEQRIASLKTNRISRMLPVPDSHTLRRDLKNLHFLIASGAPLTVESRLQPGQRVRIKSGPLSGLEGTIIQRRGQPRLLVSVDFLQQGASVTIEDYLLEPIDTEIRKSSGTIEY